MSKEHHNIGSVTWLFQDIPQDISIIIDRVPDNIGNIFLVTG